MRFRIIYFVILGMMCFLILGLVHLTVVEGGKYKGLSDKNSIRVMPAPGSRGRIIDRNGAVLVNSKLSYDVVVVPQKLNQIEQILTKTASALGASRSDLKERFKRGYKGLFVPVKIAGNIGRAGAIALEEMKFELPGLVIQPTPVRRYPFGALACHIFGYVNQIDYWRLLKLQDFGYQQGDMVGYSGIEEKYDYYLRPQEGGTSVEVDHRGRMVRMLAFRQPRHGRDIQVTLDARIQKISEDALGDKKGCVIVMDPDDGAVITMASSPRFTPGSFADKEQETLAALFRDPGAALINRAISSAYPPGSVFKPVVAVAGLETHKIDSATSYGCAGGMNVGARFFKCWDTHGQEDLTRAIAHSCDIFFYRTGLALGPQALHDYALKFGLSRFTGFELPYETGGHIPSPNERRGRMRAWFDGDTANFSIGQGDVLTSPLQIVRMMAAFANGGYLVKPYVVMMVAGRDISRFQRRAQRLPFKRACLDEVRAGLREVINNPSGTAHALADAGVAVAGKTGTAQSPPGETHAWFVGYFPSERPRYVMCVFLERGGPGHAAVLAAKEIIGKMLEQGLV